MPPAAVARPPRCRNSMPAGAAQQGNALPRRPADNRGARGRHAPRRRGRPRPRVARPDRHALARRAAHLRGARARRSRPGPRRGSLLVRNGKGGRRREVGMDDWAWEQLGPWLEARVELPVGPLFCIVTGPTHRRPWSAAAARSELRHVAREAGVRRRFAPHQLRHAHAVEMAREGVPLIVIQRQLGHTNLASPRSTCRASTAPRSSTPSTPAAPRWSPSTAR
jgi:integrase